MKSKVIGILVIMLIVMLPVSVFAYGGIDTNITIGGTDAAQSSVPVTNRIVGVLQVVGTIISVIALIIIGMRYMLSSVEEKAQMKGVIGYYIIGCLLVFTTSNVLKFAYTVVDDMKHEWVVIDRKDPTCTASGYVTSKCSNCEKTYTSITPALGHDYGAPVTHGATCTESGYTEKKCKRVGCTHSDRVNGTAALEHDWKEIKRTPATCETNGTIEYVCNRDSSHTYIDNKTLTKLPHTPVKDKAVPKTCTTPGKTEGSHCSVCNTVIVAQEIIEASHTIVTDEAIAKTCTTDGKTEGKHCSACGYVEKEQENISAGHTWGEWTTKTSATCTKEGVQERNCTACTNGHDEKKIDALGHKEVALGMKEEGYLLQKNSFHIIAYMCQRCGDNTKPREKGNCEFSKSGNVECNICKIKRGDEAECRVVTLEKGVDCKAEHTLTVWVNSATAEKNDSSMKGYNCQIKCSETRLDWGHNKKWKVDIK